MSSAEAISLTGLPTATVRKSAPTSGPNLLTDAFAALNIENYHEWAWANYKRVVRDLSERFKARRLIEIGGGRDPLFDRNEVAELNAEMTVNDIAPGELAVLPEGYRTACFDVAGDLTDVAHLRGSFDLAFSRMVFEHVADGEQAWANLHELLAPGGVALAFVPTLYALPFVLNWLLPDKIAAAIVKLVYRHRTDDGDPVFPARYSWCFVGGDRLRNMLSALGYREVIVQPFYGHGYYRAFPIIRDIHEWFTGVAQRRDWRIFAGFAYIAARK